MVDDDDRIVGVVSVRDVRLLVGAHANAELRQPLDKFLEHIRQGGVLTSLNISNEGMFIIPRSQCLLAPLWALTPITSEMLLHAFTAIAFIGIFSFIPSYFSCYSFLSPLRFIFALP